MTAELDIDVYPHSPFYINIRDFDNADAYLPEHQKVGEVESALEKVVRIQGKRFPYSSGAKARNSESLINAVHYKLTSDRLEQTESSGGQGDGRSNYEEGLQKRRSATSQGQGPLFELSENG